jgi:hypothetical protein
VHLERVLPLSDKAPGVARAFLSEALPGWIAPFQLEDAAIVASELVALALGCATTVPVLRLAAEADSVRLTIDGLPCPADDLVREMDEVSRDVVDMLADKWGATDGQHGTELWFEMIPEAGLF